MNGRDLYIVFHQWRDVYILCVDIDGLNQLPPLLNFFVSKRLIPILFVKIWSLHDPVSLSHHHAPATSLRRKEKVKRITAKVNEY